MLQLVTEEAVGKNTSEAKILLDEKTIKALKEEGIITIKLLNYLLLIFIVHSLNPLQNLTEN